MTLSVFFLFFFVALFRVGDGTEKCFARCCLLIFVAFCLFVILSLSALGSILSIDDIFNSSVISCRFCFRESLKRFKINISCWVEFYCFVVQKRCCWGEKWDKHSIARTSGSLHKVVMSRINSKLLESVLIEQFHRHYRLAGKLTLSESQLAIISCQYLRSWRVWVMKVDALIGNLPLVARRKKIQISHVTNHLLSLAKRSTTFRLFLFPSSLNKLFSYVKNVEMDRKISREYKQDRGWFHQIYLLYFSSLAERINCFSPSQQSRNVSTTKTLCRVGKAFVARVDGSRVYWFEKCHSLRFKAPQLDKFSMLSREMFALMKSKFYHSSLPRLQTS